MNNSIKIVGIDISSDRLDAYSHAEGHHQFKNNDKGFAGLVKTYGSAAHYVMESSGCYHVLLALYLSSQGIAVSVENGLTIKRFIQMRLTKVKTDKADAKLICEYGSYQELRLWKAPDAVQQAGSSMFSLLQFYEKLRVQIQNKLHRENALGLPSKMVVNLLKNQLKTLSSEVKNVEKELEKLMKTLYKDELKLLRSIPGIGVKTSLFIVMMTDGMRNFETSGQLCSYAGLTPVIRESGKSVRSRPRISKMGSGVLRKLLYMCSMNAVKYNKACKELYERITAQGKSGKVALVAVCCKLLKQSFGILKSRTPYSENFSLKFA